MSARLRLPLVAATAATGVLLGSVVPPSAEAQTSPGALEGELQPGGISLLHWGGGTPETLVDVAIERGCDLVSVWVTVTGGFVGYVPGAPAFANARFRERLADGALPRTPVVVVCRVTPDDLAITAGLPRPAA